MAKEQVKFLVSSKEFYHTLSKINMKSSEDAVDQVRIVKRDTIHTITFWLSEDVATAEGTQFGRIIDMHVHVVEGDAEWISQVNVNYPKLRAVLGQISEQPVTVTMSDNKLALVSYF